MILLAGFLEVLLKGLVLAGLAVAVGGILFTSAVLRPLTMPGSFGREAGRRVIALVTAGGITVAAGQFLDLLLAPWAFADELGRWPVTEFLATGFARAGLVHAGLALGLAAAGAWLLKSPASRSGWAAMVASAVLLLASGAWLTHAASRLEGAAPLMTVTIFHQLAAAAWIGGVLHLASLWRLLQHHPEAQPAWPDLLARFSLLAIPSVGALAAAGLYLSRHFAGGLEGLVGTAYGTLILTKAAMLAGALTLGGMNFFLVRRWLRRKNRSGVFTHVPALVEAEAGVGLVILLVAASLTSQPPAIDLVSEWATPAQVLEVFAPKAPRLTPPPYREMLTHSRSVLDAFSLPGELERSQSNFNHNMAGLLLLLVGLGAVLDRSGKTRSARHWPLLFLLLAGFLVLFAEPTVWPLGPEGFWSTLIVPEVLQHRLATLLVIGLALLEWRVRVGGLARTRWRFAFPLLCAAGGALLLTHSHTVFATRWAFLIETSHAAIGFLAVLMGLGRWLELRLPPSSGRLPGLLWTACLVLIGTILLFYRE